MAFIDKTNSFYLLVIIFVISLPIAFIIGAGLLLPTKPVIKPFDSDQYVTILDSKIRYQIYTNNGTIRDSDKNMPALILIHGFGNYKEQWKKVTPGISYHTIIGLDMIGFGGSDSPNITYNIETQRKYLLAFMDELKINKAVLAGISMGASISAWTAANSQDRIDNVILIAPSAYPGSLSKNWPYNWFYRPGIVNQFTSMLVGNPVYKTIFPNSMGAQAIDVTSSYNSDFANALHQINQPTLLVWSKGDNTTLFKFSDEYRSRIENLTFVEMPEKTGHNILRRAPEQTSKLINEFLLNVNRN